MHVKKLQWGEWQKNSHSRTCSENDCLKNGHFVQASMWELNRDVRNVEKNTQIIIIFVNQNIFWYAICLPGCSYVFKIIQQIKLPSFFLAVLEIGAPFVQPCSGNTGAGRDLYYISRTKGLGSGTCSWSCRDSTVVILKCSGACFRTGVHP